MLLINEDICSCSCFYSKFCLESDDYYVLRLSLTRGDVVVANNKNAVSVYYYAHLQPLLGVTQSVAIPDAICSRVR